MDDQTYKEFREREIKYVPNDNLFEIQKDITEEHRFIVIDWLIQVSINLYKCSNDTLYFAINFIDRYLSLKEISKKKFQLLASTCFLIANKYEDVINITIDEIVDLCGRAYERDDFIKMEINVMNTLKYNLMVITPLSYYDRYITFFKSEESKNCFNYLCEVSFFQTKLIGTFPSIITASCVYITRLIFDNIEWDDEIEKLSGFKYKNIESSIILILMSLMFIKYPCAVYKKYLVQLKSSISFKVSKISVEIEEKISKFNPIKKLI